LSWPICVCEFTEALPLGQPTVSHHLKELLRDAGMVVLERRRTWIYYRLAQSTGERLANALKNLLSDAAEAVFS
jgi:ArsR family transcriptional regulator